MRPVVLKQNIMEEIGRGFSLDNIDDNCCSNKIESLGSFLLP